MRSLLYNQKVAGKRSREHYLLLLFGVLVWVDAIGKTGSISNEPQQQSQKITVDRQYTTNVCGQVEVGSSTVTACRTTPNRAH
jgi:hypothetical protein